MKCDCALAVYQRQGLPSEDEPRNDEEDSRNEVIAREKDPDEGKAREVVSVVVAVGVLEEELPLCVLVSPHFMVNPVSQKHCEAFQAIQVCCRAHDACSVVALRLAT